MKRLTVIAVASCGLIVSLVAPVATAAEVEQATLSACLTDDQRIVKPAFGDAPASPCSTTEIEVRWMVERALPEPTSNGDLIEGATLATREVEPGVLRIVEDGDRKLRNVHDVVAGLDGSVWVFWNDRFAKLGDPTTHRWSNDLFDTGQDSSEDIEVGPDGTVWWADAEGDGLQSFDGNEWTMRRAPPTNGRVDQVEVLGDGTVIASWWLGGRGDERRKLARLDGGRWTLLDSMPGSADARLGVSEAGEVVMYLPDAAGQRLYRGSFAADGEASLKEIDLPVGRVVYVDTGSDGTTWVHLQRNLRPCERADCAVRERQVLARLDETGWSEFGLADGLGDIGGLMTAPDGSVWSATCGFLDETGRVPGCELLSFDGETWSRFLGSKGYGDIDEIAFATDGNVWSISGPNDLFVVYPEALAVPA